MSEPLFVSGLEEMLFVNSWSGTCLFWSSSYPFVKDEVVSPLWDRLPDDMNCGKVASMFLFQRKPQVQFLCLPYTGVSHDLFCFYLLLRS